MTFSIPDPPLKNSIVAPPPGLSPFPLSPQVSASFSDPEFSLLDDSTSFSIDSPPAVPSSSSRSPQKTEERSRWKTYDRIESAQRKRADFLSKRKQFWIQEQEKIQRAKIREFERRSQIARDSDNRQRNAEARRVESLGKIKEKSSETLQKVNEALFIHNLNFNYKRSDIIDDFTQRQLLADSRRRRLQEQISQNLKKVTDGRIEKARRAREMIETEKLKKFQKNEEKRLRAKERSFTQEEDSPSQSRLRQSNDDFDWQTSITTILIEGNRLTDQLKSFFDVHFGEQFSLFLDSELGKRTVNIVSDLELLIVSLDSVSSSSTPVRKAKKCQYFKNFERIILEIFNVCKLVDSNPSNRLVFSHFLIYSGFLDHLWAIVFNISDLESLFWSESRVQSIQMIVKLIVFDPLFSVYYFIGRKQIQLLSFLFLTDDNNPPENFNCIIAFFIKLLMFDTDLQRNFELVLWPFMEYTLESINDLFNFLIDTSFFQFICDGISKNTSAYFKLINSIIDCLSLFPVDDCDRTSTLLSSLLPNLIDLLSTIVLSNENLLKSPSKRRIEAVNSNTFATSPFAVTLKNVKTCAYTQTQLQIINKSLCILNFIFDSYQTITIDLITSKLDLNLELIHCFSILLSLCAVNVSNEYFYSSAVALLDLFCIFAYNENTREIFSNYSVSHMTLLSRIVSLPFVFLTDRQLKYRLLSLICLCTLCESNRPIIFEELNSSILKDFLENSMDFHRVLTVELRDEILEILAG
ncbi:hypothetical protein RCL1_000929 [Eukaryota sp. TZLM3-RCL]